MNETVGTSRLKNILIYIDIIRHNKRARVRLGIWVLRYTARCRSHKWSCWCRASSEEQVLVWLVRIYHTLNHGKCTPIRCRLPSKEWECNLSECTQPSTPTPEYCLQDWGWPLCLCLEWSQQGTRGSPGGFTERSVFEQRRVYHSRRSGWPLQEVAQRYRLPCRYSYRI